MDLVKCPFCGKEIEDNSFYCDQCGEMLKLCPTHGFKKGKICSDCGSKLVDAKDAGNNTAPSAQPVTQQPIQQPAPKPTQQSTQPPAPQPTTTPQSTIGGVPPVYQPDVQASTVEKTVRPNIVVAPKCLVSQQLNARLDITENAVIGRKTGNFVSVFGSQGYVSGTHARLQKNTDGSWEIVDLDSSNGTFLNGIKIAPNQPAKFKIGDVISFYDLKFTVE
ncbi:hypothetical protein FACS1894201_05970 [Bacteroidia bacterium]|nr:hypothetical protein FACS1894201_05970 [Bacteroidia bacterium]